MKAFYKDITTQRGFTIVELLIVIVIIAILAAITIVAYNGIQQRARDSQRLQDVVAMQKALNLYKIDNGSLPASAPNPGNSTWEISTDPGFLASVSTYAGGKTFADPINTTNSSYWYRIFAAGSGGCPASLGLYYIIWVHYAMETQSTSTLQTNGCPNQTAIPAYLTVDKRNSFVWGFTN